jgi:hypothetical protein
MNENHGRVIVHLDIDCFYAQVKRKALTITSQSGSAGIRINVGRVDPDPGEQK